MLAKMAHYYRLTRNG